MASDPSDKIWVGSAICQMSSSSISFIASSIVAITVARSKSTERENIIINGRTITSTSLTSTLWTSPYHRIIFGLSIADILHSFAIITGPFAPPIIVPQALWAAGNNVTCKMNGILFTIGSMCTPLYTFFLCYYCWYKVTRNVTNNTFHKGFEKRFHIFILAINFFACVLGLATSSFNTSATNGKICSFAAVPTGCRQQPDFYGECDERIAGWVQINTFAFTVGVPLLCLIGVIVSMSKICWYVMISSNMIRSSKKKIQRAYRDSEQGQAEPQTEPEQLNSGNLARRYRKEFMIQGILYVLSFLSTNVIAWIAAVRLTILKKDIEGDGGIFLYVASVLYPLGGFFNILVYSRPKVIVFRRNNPQISWIRAFTLVIRAGAVVPMVVVQGEGASPVLPRHQRRFLRHGLLVEEENSSDLLPTSSRAMFRSLSSNYTPSFMNLAESSDIISRNTEATDSGGRKYYPGVLEAVAGIDMEALQGPEPTSTGAASSTPGMDTIMEEPGEE